MWGALAAAVGGQLISALGNRGKNRAANSYADWTQEQRLDRSYVNDVWDQANQNSFDRANRANQGLGPSMADYQRGGVGRNQHALARTAFAGAKADNARNVMQTALGFENAKFGQMAQAAGMFGAMDQYEMGLRDKGQSFRAGVKADIGGQYADFGQALSGMGAQGLLGLNQSGGNPGVAGRAGSGASGLGRVGLSTANTFQGVNMTGGNSFSSQFGNMGGRQQAFGMGLGSNFGNTPSFLYGATPQLRSGR